MVVVLKTVGLLRRSVFVLPKGKRLDLIKIFNKLHESDLCSCVSFDERFGRIILKQKNFTLTCFSSGKVMVCGLASEKEVLLFLKKVWKLFFYKNLQTM